MLQSFNEIKHLTYFNLLNFNQLCNAEALFHEKSPTVTKNSNFQNVEISQTKSKSSSDFSYTEILPNQGSLKKAEREAKQSSKTDGKVLNINSKSVSKYSMNNSENLNNTDTMAMDRIASIETVINSIKGKNKGNGKRLQKLNNQKKKIIIERKKRSLQKKSTNIGFHKTLLPNRFYRHPRLSYEEQQQLTEKLAKDMNLNFGSTLSKRVLDMFSNPQPKLVTEPLSKESTKHNYVPIFPKCDTGNSEVDDLNKPVLARMENNSESNENERGTDDNSWPQNFERMKDIKGVSEESSESSIEQTKSLEGTETPNSNRGPFVSAHDQLDKTYINIEDHQKHVEENTSPDTPAYDPEKIPYVEVPDYSDIKEESLDDDQGNEKNLKQKDVDFIDLGVKDPEGGSQSSKDEEAEKNWEKKGSKSSKDSLSENNAKVDELEENKEVSKKDEGFKSQKVSEESQEQDNVKELESIIFDINEYRKPFNLDEFLKDDPIMKKLELLEKETRAIYGENRKQVPGFFNMSESDNASTDRASRREDSVEERDRFDPSSDFINTFAETRSNTKSSRKAAKKEDSKDNFAKFNQNGKDQDFARFDFGKNRDTPSRFRKGKSLSSYLMEDAVESLQDDTTEGYKGRKDLQRRGDMHALSAILNKKNRVPRLNEDDERIKLGDSPAYNFWSLEYDSPRKKADMEAQEKRK